MDRHPNLRVDRNKKHGKDGRRQPSAPVALRIGAHSLIPLDSPCHATRAVCHRRGMRCDRQSASLHFRSKSQPHLAVILLARWKQLLVVGDIQQVEPG